MKEIKLTTADIDKVRHIEGFPIGSDDAIIALSHAPVYTACPNPFVADFIAQNGTVYDVDTDDYQREPFTADVSEGKNDAFYMAHSYHTKVPHKAIMKYILHYTNPDDIVYDGFCGTGMTGVAAQMCACPDADYKLSVEKEMPHVKWGGRKAVLSDLAPAASFIAASYNQHIDIAAFQEQASDIIADCKRKFGWMFETKHSDSGFLGGVNGHINYIVWSHTVLCPHCGKEMVLYDMMWNPDTKKMSETFSCPQCQSIIKKNDCDKSFVTELDELTGEVRSRRKAVPVLINYSVGKKRYEKRFDDSDIAVYEKISGLSFAGDAPHNPMMRKGEMWGETWRAGTHAGITHVHHFYHKRTLLVLEYLYTRCKDNQRLSLRISLRKNSLMS